MNSFYAGLDYNFEFVFEENASDKPELKKKKKRCFPCST